MSAIVLASTFPFVTPGNVVQAGASDAFFNKWPFPILIDEVSFDYAPAINGNNVGQIGNSNLGDVLRTKIVYQTVPVTNGFVPLNLLSRVKNWEVNVPGVASFGGFGSSPDRNVTWTFPAPLYLPVNGKLDIQLQAQNDFFSNNGLPVSTNVRVAVRGRIASLKPATIDIPYAAAFLGSVFGQSVLVNGVQQVGLSAPQTEESGPADLYNPFNEPMAVERFVWEVSRTGYLQNGANAANVFGYAPADGLQGGGAIANGGTNLPLIGASIGAPFAERFISAKITDHTGHPIVRDFFPIAAILSNNTRSWPCKSILGPLEFYRAIFYENPGLFAANPLGDAATPAFQARVGVSIIGSRRVPNPEVR